MDGWWCPPDMVVVAGPVPAGIYKKPVNSLRLSVPKGAGLAREPILVSGCGVLTMQPCSLRDLRRGGESRPEPSRLATSTGRPGARVRPTPGAPGPEDGRSSPMRHPPHPLGSGHAEPQVVVPVVRRVPV